MKKQFAALLAALSLLPTLALAQDYYTLPEIRDQAKDGWHETYTDKSGKKVTQTEWHNIVVWRGLADIAEKYVKSGKLLFRNARFLPNGARRVRWQCAGWFSAAA